MVLAALLTAIIAVALLLAWTFTWDRQPILTGDGEYRFRCPVCDRKLRYRSNQVGHSAKCPRCGNACTLPPGEEIS